MNASVRLVASLGKVYWALLKSFPCAPSGVPVNSTEGVLLISQMPTLSLAAPRYSNFIAISYRFIVGLYTFVMSSTLIGNNCLFKGLLVGQTLRVQLYAIVGASWEAQIVI